MIKRLIENYPEESIEKTQKLATLMFMRTCLLWPALIAAYIRDGGTVK